MADVPEELNFLFYFILMNLHLNVNSNMWLVTTISGSAVLDIFPMHLRMFLTHRLFCIFMFYINIPVRVSFSFLLFVTDQFIYIYIFFFFVFLSFFRAAPAAYGGSQARGLIGAVVAGLRHSHSNARSKPRLRPTPQLMAMPDPSPTERGQGLNLCSYGC